MKNGDDYDDFKLGKDGYIFGNYKKYNLVKEDFKPSKRTKI